MTRHSKVIFHLAGRFVKNYQTMPHLQLFERIHWLCMHLGIEVETRRRVGALRDGGRQDWSDILEPQHLHIIENGNVAQKNALNTTLSYLQPYFHLDANGVLANSSAYDADYLPGRVSKQKSTSFWHQLQERYVRPRRSRYTQPKENITIPENSIGVFLQGEFPHKWQTAYCSAEDMLRTVVQNSGGRSVVVKAHPESDVLRESEMIHQLLREGLPLIPIEANVHDILAQCDLTVSFNSAVSIEGFLHNKPTVLFGKSDFHHVSETVRKPEEFPSAMTRALSSSHDYADYLTWYFTNFCFSLNDPELDQKLIERLNENEFLGPKIDVYASGPNSIHVRTFAARSLERVVGAKKEVKRLRVIEGLKVTEGSWVFVARLNGEKVVIKRFLGEGSAHTVKALKGELDYLETVWTSEAFSANLCLYAWPEDGIVVLSHAPGKRLGDKISGATGQSRARLLKKSGEWLKEYASSRQRESNFGPKFWIQRLKAIQLDHIVEETDQQLLSALLQDLRVQSNQVRGAKVVQAATHGDFVGINAHFHKGAICGVDIQGECWLALAKEAARFLVWQHIHDGLISEKCFFGLHAQDVEAFLSSGVLPSVESKTTFPFFIGEQLYERFVTEYDRPSIRSNTRLAISAYLQHERCGER